MKDPLNVFERWDKQWTRFLVLTEDERTAYLNGPAVLDSCGWVESPYFQYWYCRPLFDEHVLLAHFAASALQQSERWTS